MILLTFSRLFKNSESTKSSEVCFPVKEFFDQNIYTDIKFGRKSGFDWKSMDVLTKLEFQHRAPLERQFPDRNTSISRIDDLFQGLLYFFRHSQGMSAMELKERDKESEEKEDPWALGS